MIGLTMLATALTISGDAELQHRIDRAPTPVRNLIERRAGCNYFAGEEPYDKERARDLASKARALKCDAIEQDESNLRRRYARRLDILMLLASTHDVAY